MFYRSDNRSPDQMRPVNIIPNFISTAEGSVLIEVGNTRVICTASVDESVPQFMCNSGKGWISSEYSMLPRVTLTRTPREVNKGRPGGRTHEIQRLIGRSLRAVVDLERLGERTICIHATSPGGWRHTHGLDHGSLRRSRSRSGETGGSGNFDLGSLPRFSGCGERRHRGRRNPLDLCYEEDSRADVNMNFVMTAGKKFVEVQATAEHQVFDEEQLSKMIGLASQGVQALIAKQQAVLRTLMLRQ